MNKNVRIAKELLKIAKQILSSLSDKNKIKQIYNNQKVDPVVLQQLYDKYTDDISIDLQAGAKQHLKTITTISLEKWLKENGYEDWANERKYDALYDYLMKKLSEVGYQMIKEEENIYIISPQKIYEEADRQYQEKKKNHRVFKSSLHSKQEIKKLYKENIN